MPYKVDIEKQIKEEGIKLVYNNMPVSAVNKLLDLPSDKLYGKLEDSVITLYTATVENRDNMRRFVLAYLLEYARYANSEDVSVLAYATDDTMNFTKNFWLTENSTVLNNTVQTILPAASLVELSAFFTSEYKGEEDMKVAFCREVQTKFSVDTRTAIHQLNKHGFNLAIDEGKLVNRNAGTHSVKKPSL